MAVTLNNQDALVVREAMTALADYPGTKIAMHLTRWVPEAAIAADDPLVQRTILAARLRAIAAGIDGELPHELRVPGSG